MFSGVANNNAGLFFFCPQEIVNIAIISNINVLILVLFFILSLIYALFEALLILLSRCKIIKAFFICQSPKRVKM